MIWSWALEPDSGSTGLKTKAHRNFDDLAGNERKWVKYCRTDEGKWEQVNRWVGKVMWLGLEVKGLLQNRWGKVEKSEGNLVDRWWMAMNGLRGMWAEMQNMTISATTADRVPFNQCTHAHSVHTNHTLHLGIKIYTCFRWHISHPKHLCPQSFKVVRLELCDSFFLQKINLCNHSRFSTCLFTLKKKTGNVKHSEIVYLLAKVTLTFKASSNPQRYYFIRANVGATVSYD